MNDDNFVNASLREIKATPVMLHISFRHKRLDIPLLFPNIGTKKDVTSRGVTYYSFILFYCFFVEIGHFMVYKQ